MKHRPATRDAGYALVLVLIAVAIAAVVSASMLSAHAPTTAMARNASYSSQARSIAEAGADAIQAYVNDKSPNWHTHGGPTKTEGAWFAQAPLGEGTFSIWAERADGNDGVHNETFQAGDRIRVVSTGYFDGRSAQVTRIITPPQVEQAGLKVVLVAGTMPRSSFDLERVALFESWGFEVMSITDTDAQAVYDNAADWGDVFYISEEVTAGSVGTKLNATTDGVVNEEPGLMDDLGFCSSVGYQNYTIIDIYTNQHPITAGLPTGPLTIAAANTEIHTKIGTTASGYQCIADKNASGDSVLGYLERGGIRLNGSASPGRRVALPFGTSNFSINELNDNGLRIVRQAITWAADAGDLLAQWDLDETAGSVAADSINGHNGTLFNGVAMNQAGKVGTAFYFDGSNDHIEIPHNNAMLLDQGTVSMWVYPARNNNNEALFSKDSQDYDTGGHLHLYSNQGTPTARIQGTTSQSDKTLSAPNKWATNTWQHLVFSFGPAGARLYFNGTLVDSDPYTGGMGTTSGGAGNHEPLVLGAGTWSSGNLVKSPLNQYFQGRLDRVRWYRTQLSDSEIADLYNTP